MFGEEAVGVLWFAFGGGCGDWVLDFLDWFELVCMFACLIFCLFVCLRHRNLLWNDLLVFFKKKPQLPFVAKILMNVQLTAMQDLSGFFWVLVCWGFFYVCLGVGFFLALQKKQGFVKLQSTCK